MRDAFDVIGWIADNIVAPFAIDRVSEVLTLSDLGHFMVVALATILVFTIGKWLWATVLPEPEPDWETLDPDDPQQMARSFENIHIAARLAIKLEEKIAETQYDFVRQIRQLNAFKPSILNRLDPNDIEVMKRLYEKPGVTTMIARRLNSKSKTSVEEFSEQIRQDQHSKSK